jgi:hypothetical protein
MGSMTSGLEASYFPTSKETMPRRTLYLPSMVFKTLESADA